MNDSGKPSMASLVLSSVTARLIIHMVVVTGAQVAPPFLPPMAALQSYVLLQKGQDPFHTSFEDLDGLTAFTL